MKCIWHQSVYQILFILYIYYSGAALITAYKNAGGSIALKEHFGVEMETSDIFQIGALHSTNLSTPVHSN